MTLNEQNSLTDGKKGVVGVAFSREASDRNATGKLVLLIMNLNC